MKAGQAQDINGLPSPVCIPSQQVDIELERCMLIHLDEHDDSSIVPIWFGPYESCLDQATISDVGFWLPVVGCCA